MRKSTLLGGGLALLLVFRGDALSAASPPGESEGQSTAADIELEEHARDFPEERVRWNAMFRQDASGRVLSENRLKALRDACDIPIDPSMPRTPDGAYTRSDAGPTVSGEKTFSGTVWQSIGPKPIQSWVGSDRAWGNVAGRVDAIAIHPSNPAILLLGSATGGIWKSTDGGNSWRPVSDTAPALATSSIAFSQSNPSIVFATTGELDSAGMEHSPSQSMGTYLGAGLLKSVDGGETWIRSDMNLPPNAVLARVLVHPSNPLNVVVAVNSSQDVAGSGWYYGTLYRSTDGGVHFSATFDHLITDLVQDPNDPARLYLAASNLNCGGCPDAGVWLSTDFGSTWNKNFTTTSPTGNVKLGVSRTSPTSLYVSFPNGKNELTGAFGIYRSVDAGLNWTLAAVDPTMCAVSPGRNQCFYDHWIQPDPLNPSVVYFGSIDIYKSSDSASTWHKLTQNYNTSNIQVPVHPDQHVAAIVPSAPSTIYFGNDAGVYRTTDAGKTFQNLNATLSLAQFNEVVPHPTNANVAIGGTQDNGNLRFTGQSLWVDQTSGDGGFNLVRRDSPGETLVGHYQANFERSTDNGATYADVTPCNTLMDCVAGKPLPSDPMAFYPPAAAAPSAPRTVFFGTNRVWKNTTFGATKTAWTPMSAGAITTGGGVLTALDAVGNGSEAIWAGSTSGDVLFSSDGGATFAQRRTGLPNAIVTKIVAVTSDGSGAYVTFGGFLGSPSRHIFRTTNAGLSWTNISGNLPDAPITALAIDPTDSSGIFVGSDVGVFHSVNGGASWTAFNQGLPNVAVYGLAFSPVNGDLYAATYGRGAFRISNISGGASPAANFTFSPSSAQVGQVVTFADTSTGSPTSWSWTFGDGAISALQNPTHAYGTAGTFTVALTATNAEGSNTTSRSLTIIAAQVGRGHLTSVPRNGTLPPISGRH